MNNIGITSFLTTNLLQKYFSVTRKNYLVACSGDIFRKRPKNIPRFVCITMNIERFGLNFTMYEVDEKADELL